MQPTACDNRCYCISLWPVAPHYTDLLHPSFTRKCQEMKLWEQVTVAKSISKSIIDNFCQMLAKVSISVS